MKSKVILMLGAPGSGKGTQSKFFKEDGYTIFSMGDILREGNFKSCIKQELRYFTDNGLLVPDDIIFKIVEQKLSEIYCDNGIVFDGFPRNKYQVPFFEKLLKERLQNMQLIPIHLDVPIEELQNRISLRKSIQNRKDDGWDIFNKRIKIYRSETSQVIQYYSLYPNFIRIDCRDTSPEKTWDIISQEISQEVVSGVKYGLL